MDPSKAVAHVGLCAGYAGIDLGLKRAIPNLRTVALCEIEAYACANLVCKMESGELEPSPIWTNLKTFPWASFRGRVGILSGGYPCQPFSNSGKRHGKDDERHLWPWIADGIDAMRPIGCFFENVEGHVSLGLGAVISDLSGLGYVATAGIFSAAEVGADHLRKRLFILAHANGARLPRPRDEHPESGALLRDAKFTGPRFDWRADVWPSPLGELLRAPDGSANRMDRVRLCGNGVHPGTAELAYRTLYRELNR